MLSRLPIPNDTGLSIPFAHEVRHWLDLCHTFDEGCGGVDDGIEGKRRVFLKRTGAS
jgi:hypothetical protein